MTKKRRRGLPRRRRTRSTPTRRVKPIWRKFRRKIPSVPAQYRQQAAQLRSRIPPSRMQAELERVFDEGMKHFNAEDYKGALDKLLLCQALMEGVGQSQPLAFNIGQCYASLGDYQRARRWHEVAVAMKPKDPDPYFPLAQIALEEGRYEDCIALSERGRRLLGPHTRDPKGLSNLAHAYHDLGYIDKAIELLKQGLQLDPDWAIGHQGLGACYEDKADLGRALYHYRQAARLEPTNASARECVERLESGYFIARLFPGDLEQEERMASLEPDQEKLAKQIRREADELEAQAGGGLP